MIFDQFHIFDSVPNFFPFVRNSFEELLGLIKKFLVHVNKLEYNSVWNYLQISKKSSKKRDPHPNRKRLRLPRILQNWLL